MTGLRVTPLPTPAACVIRRVLRIAELALAIIVVAGLAGCADASNSTMSAAQPMPPQPHGMAAGGAGAATTGSSTFAGPAGGPATAGTTAPNSAIAIGTAGSAIERSVTAAYTIPGGTFLASLQNVTARAVAGGGYVVSSTTQPDSTGRIISGSVSMKVPAATLADFLGGMPSTFTASSVDFASVDHTAAFIDLTARLSSAHAHLAALNGLLARATTLADITSLEEQVATVQTEIDTEQGQRNVLDASVALATATVHLSERGAVAVPPSPPSPVSNGVGTGWSNAVQVTGAVLEGLVTVMPLLIIAILGLLIWRWVMRATLPRRRARPPAG